MKSVILFLSDMVMLPQQVREERGRHQGWEGSAVEEKKTEKKAGLEHRGWSLGGCRGLREAKLLCQLDVNWVGHLCPSLVGNLTGWRRLREVKADILTGRR